MVYKEGYPDEFSLKLFEEAGVIVERYADLCAAEESKENNSAVE